MDDFDNFGERLEAGFGMLFQSSPDEHDDPDYDGQVGDEQEDEFSEFCQFSPQLHRSSLLRVVYRPLSMTICQAGGEKPKILRRF
jgi:hypothetical protein